LRYLLRREMSDFNKVLSQFSKSKPSYRYSSAKKLLQIISEQKLRESAVVVAAGGELLDHHKSKLGEDVWDMYERVFMAALDCHDNKHRDRCIDALIARFPDSNRVRMLSGLLKEERGDYTGALELYDIIMEQDPVNMKVWKRKVCIHKAQGCIPDAITELTKYTKVFPTDQGAWQELAALYISIGKFEMAKFCLEELLMFVPENYLYHLQYAEVLFSLSSHKKENNYILLARQYYCQSLELNPDNNLRALYGLILCLRRKNGCTKPLHRQLYEWSVNRLKTHYRTQLPEWDEDEEAIVTAAIQS